MIQNIFEIPHLRFLGRFNFENTVKPRKCLRRKASSDRSDEFTTNLLLLEKLAALRNSQLNKFNIPPAGL